MRGGWVLSSSSSSLSARVILGVVGVSRVTVIGLLAVSSGFGPAWRVDGGKIVSLTA